MLKVKRGCYTIKDIEKVSSGKVKYDSLTGKSVTDPTIGRFSPHMNKILGISNGNYVDMLLSKKVSSFKIDKLSTADNIFNGKPCDLLYTGTSIETYHLPSFTSIETYHLPSFTSIETYHLPSFTLNQRTFSIKS